MFSALIEYISLRSADRLNEVQVVLNLHCGNSCINEHWKNPCSNYFFLCIPEFRVEFSVYVLLELRDFE